MSPNSPDDHVPDAVLRRTLTRRDLMRRASLMVGGAAAMAAVPSLAACGASSGGDDKRVVVADWGGAIQDAERKHLYDPFTKETGIEVVISGPPSDAKVKAMVDSGNVEWDLVAGSLSSVLALGRKYFEPLPADVLGVTGMPDKYKDSHALAYYVFSTNIGWNTKMLPSAKLESWADVWNTGRFPGKRTLEGSDGGSDPALEFALLADGVDIKNLYPLDIDRAMNALRRLKPSVAQWWSSGAQPGTMLVSKQVSCASIWIGRIDTLRGQGAPIGFTFNQGELIPASWIVPKGAPNKKAAFQLAKYSVQPEVQARLWGSYLEGPTNQKAFDKIGDAWGAKLPTHPDNEKLQFVRDEEWWGKNRVEVIRRWQELIL